MEESKRQASVYRSIVDTARDTVIITNDSDGIISFNPSELFDIFGYTADEASGLDLRTLLPGLTGDSRDKYMHSTVVEGVIVGFGYAVIGCRKNGTTILLDLSVTKGISPQNLPCFTWILRDASERLRLNSELRSFVQKAQAASAVEGELLLQVQHSNNELKRANDDLQKFTSIIAHDLRGPLRRIEAMVAILISEFRPALDEDGSDVVDRIARGATRMRLMLDSLLEYSRFSAVAIDGKTADLGEVVRDALTAFDTRALGVEIRLDLGDVTDIKGDPVLLSHVLQNLIANAIKFRSLVSPVITVQAQPTGPLISIAVTDNGIGIEAKYAEKIFDMFYRLNGEEDYEGTGIGLAVCKKIINDHRGQIWLDTTSTDLTKFVFTVPAASQADLVAPKRPTKRRHASALTKTSDSTG